MWLYKIKYMDKETWNEKTESGLIGANNIGNVMKYLCNYYSENNIIALLYLEKMNEEDFPLIFKEPEVTREDFIKQFDMF